MTKHQLLTATFSNEDQFQSACHKYLNVNFPELRHFYAHVPNENSHKLLNLGVLAGFPDFIFLKPETFFIELKMPNGTLSPKQKALHKLWQSAGIKVFTAWNAKDFLKIIEQFDFCIE